MIKILTKILKAVLYFSGVLTLGFLLTHCTFSHYAKKTYAQAKKEKPFDVIIVPGAPYLYGSVSNVIKMRLYWAKQLYDSGYTKNIIFSGSSVYTPYVEGIVMKIMADSLGIPSDHTFSETCAEHSTENIYYSWKMAKEMGFTKIGLATDPYQAGMLRNFTKKYCPDIKPIPIIFGTMEIGNKTLPKIDSTAAYVENFVSITKRESFWQRLRGTRGKRVKEEIECQSQTEMARIKKKKDGSVVTNTYNDQPSTMDQ
jgi:uncharacterized SAM-binding protein YcdF (DUF218 family)